MKKLLISALLVINISGCSGLPKSAAMQLRSNFLLLKADYQSYLDKDPKFDNDPDGKADRLGLIDDSVKLIDESVK